MFFQRTRFHLTYPVRIHHRHFDIHIRRQFHFQCFSFALCFVFFLRNDNGILLCLHHFQRIFQITVLVVENDFSRTAVIAFIRCYNIFQRVAGHTPTGSLVGYPVHIRHLYAIFHITLDIHRNGFTGITHETLILRKQNESSTGLIYLHGFHFISALERNFPFTVIGLLVNGNIQLMYIGCQGTAGSLGYPIFGICCNLHLISDICLDFDFYPPPFWSNFILGSSNQQSICCFLCNGKGLAHRTRLDGYRYTTVFVIRIFCNGEFHIGRSLASTSN